MALANWGDLEESFESTEYVGMKNVTLPLDETGCIAHCLEYKYSA